MTSWQIHSFTSILLLHGVPELVCCCILHQGSQHKKDIISQTEKDILVNVAAHICSEFYGSCIDPYLYFTKCT